MFFFLIGNKDNNHNQANNGGNSLGIRKKNLIDGWRKKGKYDLPSIPIEPEKALHSIVITRSSIFHCIFSEVIVH